LTNPSTLSRGTRRHGARQPRARLSRPRPRRPATAVAVGSPEGNLLFSPLTLCHPNRGCDEQIASEWRDLLFPSRDGSRIRARRLEVRIEESWSSVRPNRWLVERYRFPPGSDPTRVLQWLAPHPRWQKKRCVSTAWENCRLTTPPLLSRPTRLRDAVTCASHSFENRE